MSLGVTLFFGVTGYLAWKKCEDDIKEGKNNGFLVYYAMLAPVIAVGGILKGFL